MLYNTRKSILRRVFKHFHERILHFKTLSSIYHDDVGISTINRCIPLCVQFALLPISFYTIRSDFESVQTCYLSIDAIYYFPNNRSSVRIKTFPRNVPNEPKPWTVFQVRNGKFPELIRVATKSIDKMKYFKQSFFFFFLFVLYDLVTGSLTEEITLNVNLKEPIAVTDEKFLSLTIDPVTLLAGNALRYVRWIYNALISAFYGS